MGCSITALYRYPVKGLSAEVLTQVDVHPGEPFPFDRRWAIENGPGRFNPAIPKHLPKIAFLMLMRDERLASLETKFDAATTTLSILRDGKSVATGCLETRPGRLIIEQFMAAFMEDSLRGPPKIVSANGHSFSDTAAKRVHIINLASIRELERVIGRPVEPRRFRPNIVVDGIPAWQEFTWLGHNLTANTTTFRVHKRTDRCAATNVDPLTGTRDMDIPAVLRREWGHIDFGVYAEITQAGQLSVGADLTSG